jgi:hypothetical protein
LEIHVSARIQIVLEESTIYLGEGVVLLTLYLQNRKSRAKDDIHGTKNIARAPQRATRGSFAHEASPQAPLEGTHPWH